MDPVHNLLIVPTRGNGKVLVFDRNASGHAKPKAVIAGPVRLGNQFEVYGPNRLMLTHSRDTLEIRRIPEMWGAHRAANPDPGAAGPGVWRHGHGT